MNLFLIAILAFVFLGIALWNIRWAVFVVAALLPTYLLRFSIGPFPSTLLEIMLVIVILVWFIKHQGFRETNPRLLPWQWPLALLLAVGIIGIIVAPDTWKALGLFRAYLLEPILFFLVLLSVIRERKDVMRLIGALGLSALVISLYAIFQRLTGFGVPAPWDAVMRMTSFYPFPNAIGLFLAPLITIFTALAFGQSRRLFYGLAAALSILAIILSQTEGAWIGVGVGLVFLGLMYRKARWPTIIIVVLAAIIALGTPAIRNPVLEKVTLRDWSGQVRQTQWTETITMLSKRSIFGAGLSGYPTALEPYHKATYIEIFQYPHNIVLNFWTELGLLGVVAFGWIIFVFFKFIFGLRSSVLGYGLAAGMLALLVHGLVDVPYFKNDLAVQFWILVAIATILALPKPKNVLG